MIAEFELPVVVQQSLIVIAGLPFVLVPVVAEQLLVEAVLEAF